MTGPKVSGRPGGCLRRHIGDPPVLLDRHGAVGTAPGPRAAWKLANAVDRAPLLGQPVVEHRCHQRAWFDPQLRTGRGHQCLQLRGEDQAVATRQVVQRLDAERVPGQDEFTGPRIGQGEGEHAAELAERVRSPAPPRLKHDLGVGLGAEANATRG